MNNRESDSFYEARGIIEQAREAMREAMAHLDFADAALSAMQGDMPEPVALTRFRNIAAAETGEGRMFTLGDGREIIAYIDSLKAVQGDGWRGVEPVAWLYKRGDKTRLGLEYSEDMVPAWDATPLYALPAPPKETPA